MAQSIFFYTDMYGTKKNTLLIISLLNYINCDVMLFLKTVQLKFVVFCSLLIIAVRLFPLHLVLIRVGTPSHCLVETRDSNF